jgi:hypothetical protein
MTDPRTIDARDEAFDIRTEEDARQPLSADNRVDDARNQGRILDMREAPEVRDAQMGQRSAGAALKLLSLPPFSNFMQMAQQGKGNLVTQMN